MFATLTQCIWKRYRMLFIELLLLCFFFVLKWRDQGENGNWKHRKYGKGLKKNTGNDFSVAERVHEIHESHKRGRENSHSPSVHFQPLPFIKQWETHKRTVRRTISDSNFPLVRDRESSGFSTETLNRGHAQHEFKEIDNPIHILWCMRSRIQSVSKILNKNA